MNETNYSTRSSSGRTWCGPYAFAILTGRTYDQAEKWLRKLLNRKQKIQGIYWDEARFVSGNILKWKRLRGVHNLTFHQLKDHLLANRQYLVAYTSHFVVVDTRTWKVIDNNRHWTDYDKWSKRNKVKHVWQTTTRPLVVSA